MISRIKVNTVQLADRLGWLYFVDPMVLDAFRAAYPPRQKPVLFPVVAFLAPVALIFISFLENTLNSDRPLILQQDQPDTNLAGAASIGRPSLPQVDHGDFSNEFAASEKVDKEARLRQRAETLAQALADTEEMLGLTRSRLAKAEAEAHASKDAAYQEAARADQEVRLRQRAETEREETMLASARLDQAKAQAEAVRAETGREKSEEEDRIRQRAESQRAAQAEARADAEMMLASAKLEQAKAQAEAQTAKQAAANAEATRQKSEEERTALRIQLREQLNKILQTEDTARGLIVNMSDVLFDFGQYTLRPGAREKLTKISGVLLAHPGLKMQVEGYTDSVGSDEFNQSLSELRTDTVRDFLVQQGVSGSSITAKGFGKTRPVATNDTAAGRQRNRRVEIVVSGESIRISSTK